MNQDDKKILRKILANESKRRIIKTSWDLHVGNKIKCGDTVYVLKEVEMTDTGSFMLYPVEGGVLHESMVEPVLRDLDIENMTQSEIEEFNGIFLEEGCEILEILSVKKIKISWEKGKLVKKIGINALIWFMQHGFNVEQKFKI